MREEQGLPPEEDYSEEEAFCKLEREYEALGELLRSSWRAAKKRMRKEMYASLLSELFHSRREGGEYEENS